MNNNKKHIDNENFKRYLAGQMTNKERNAFEKKLQKDAFNTEAIEGYEAFPSLNFNRDIKTLQNKIKKEKHRNRLSLIAAAATILLLITAGIIYTNIKQQNPLPVVTENKIEKADKKTKTETKTGIEAEVKMPEELSPKTVSKEIERPELQSTTNAAPTIKEISIFQKRDTQDITGYSQIEENITLVEEPMPSITIEDTESELEVDEIAQFPETISVQTNKIIKGQVIASDDKQPISGVSITEQGTKNATISDINGRFQLNMQNDTNLVVANFIGMEQKATLLSSDSNNTIILTPDNHSLSEVAVVAYGSKKQKTKNRSSKKMSTEQTYSPAQPICGFSKYNDYLKEHAILPANHNRNKIVVKLQLEINSSGNITSIKNTNNADKKYLDKAKTIIQNGPNWQPQITKAGKTKTKVNINIIFRKDKQQNHNSLRINKQ